MQKDSAGPIHKSEQIPLEISGAWLERYPTVEYQYGFLSEVTNRAWPGMHQDHEVGHMYFVLNNGAEPRVEWYVHQKTIDRYVLVTGQLRVALFDDRVDSPTYGKLQVFEIGGLLSKLPQGLCIPPGVWHSFKSIDGEFLFLNSKHPGYNQADPDKFRMSMPNEKCEFNWG
jgi:dTDP-4-dehydrorhamnose 3,5-epimerase-like enzyme